jgi:uncharacterized membrane protein HdeD (DUF308 family)
MPARALRTPSQALDEYSRVSGLVWIIAGIVVSSPGLTIPALAIVAGIALVVGGLIKIASALFGDDDDRFILGISGLTSVIFGVLALAWLAAS